MLYYWGSKVALAQLGMSKHAGRMERALRAGEIAVEDLFPKTEGLPQGIKQIRDKLWMPSKSAPNIGTTRRRRIVQSFNKKRNFETDTGGDVDFGLLEKDEPSAYSGQFRSTGSAPHIQVQAREDVPSMFLPALEHELAEARLYKDHFGNLLEPSQKPFRPISTHLGVEPVVRDLEHSVGDKTLQDLLHGTSRITKNPEEEFVHKTMRHLGATPDKPMALGGKQEKAYNKLYDQRKARNVQHKLKGQR